MIGQAVNFIIMYWAFVIPVVLLVLLLVSRAFRGWAALVLRVIARPLLLAAVVAMVYDGTRTLAGNSGIVFTSLAEHWQTIHPASMAAFKAAISRLHPLAWEQGAFTVLKLPAWAVIGTLGLALAWIGRKRQQPQIFVN